MNIQVSTILGFGVVGLGFFPLLQHQVTISDHTVRIFEQESCWPVTARFDSDLAV